MNKRSFLSFCLLMGAVPAVAQTAPAETTPSAPSHGKAKNIILFLADAGGVPVIHAASLLGYGEPRKLRVQQWPHLGLSDTSPVDEFVSDSANGMSSIMTGIKTRNGVISQGPDAARGRQDGRPTQTLLEYAEERGLLTGVITTQSIADATPAATYAHSNDRKTWGTIFPQAFTPRFGDGVDVLFGAGRAEIGQQLVAAGTSVDKISARSRPRRRSSLPRPANELRRIPRYPNFAAPDGVAWPMHEPLRGLALASP